MIHGQHSVRLAAAERRLKANHRVAAAGPGQALQAGNQDPPQPFGQEGDAEKVLWNRIVFARVARVHGEQIGGEFCLFEAVGQHVRVRQRDFDPRSERFGRSSLRRGLRATERQGGPLGLSSPDGAGCDRSCRLGSSKTGTTLSIV